MFQSNNTSNTTTEAPDVSHHLPLPSTTGEHASSNNGTRILWLNDSSVDRLLSPALAVDAVRRALLCHAAGDFQQPLKPYIRPRGREEEYYGGRFIAMPAYLGGAVAAAGIKWISGFPANIDRGLPRAFGLYILNSVENGFPRAIMQGSVLSARRTGAVASLALSTLAGPGPHHVTLLGAGPIGAEVISALAACNRPAVTQICVFDPRTERAQALAAAFAPKIPVLVASCVEEALNGTSVVVLATTGAKKGHLAPALAGRKRLIVALSLDDASPELLLSADKIIVDDFDQSNREDKLLHRLTVAGRLSRAGIYAEFGEILSGSKAARHHDDEMIYLNPMGMGIEDLSVALAVYEAAVATGSGAWLS